MTDATARKSLALDALAFLVVGVLASTLLFWRVGERYLWQDEAATAVLAERMLEYGKPLAYDGRNLITMDVTAESDGEGFERRIRDPEVAVRYYAERGDYKDDTTWIGQPWGQFVLAAASLGAFGHGTWQARAPFALCGVLTVLALYWFIRSRFDDRLMAFLAALLLLANVYWVLHMRQCRYYAPSSLFLLLTVMAYLRWQDARRAGAVLFVITAWLWFQCDYGTFWPVLGVLTVDTLSVRRRTLVNSLGTLTAVAVAIAPWVVYYELYARVKETPHGIDMRLLGTIFNMNQFVIPLLLLAYVVWLIWRDFSDLLVDRRQILIVSVSVLLVHLVWVPPIAPAPYHRYIVAATPLASFLVAFAAVRTSRLVLPGPPERLSRAATAAALAFLVALTPAISSPVSSIIPRDYWRAASQGDWVRTEWRVLYDDLGGRVRDPNRELVELLRTRLRPTDEVVITYEDIPLMFYLPQKIRGGLTCFRLADPAIPRPRFFISRATVPYGDFQFAGLSTHVASRPWRMLPHDIPDFRASNCPDPALHFAKEVGGGRLLLIAEAADDVDAAQPAP